MEDLVRPAIVAAVRGAGLSPGDIDTVTGPPNIGQLLARRPP
jgi:hypothetical protein